MAAERPAGDGAIDLTGAVGVAVRGRAGRLSELSGSTIGFLDNGKAHADLVLAAAELELVRSHGVAHTVRSRKENRWGRHPRPCSRSFTDAMQSSSR